jgi:hypothetical protein
MALIITGFPGSGKSLLWKLFNSHPDIELTERFRNFLELDVSPTKHAVALATPPLGRSRMYYARTGSGNREGVLQHWKNRMFFARYFIGLLVRRKARIGVGDVESMLRRLFPHASVVGDAAASYLSALDRLTSKPGLALTIIYRDCRDVASCLLDRARRSPGAAYARRYGTAEKTATSWVSSIEAMERHADKVHLIRYEDLITHPQTILAAFGNWLGVEPQGFQYQMINTRWVGEYKQGLSDGELASIISIAGPTMERLGYL